MFTEAAKKYFELKLKKRRLEDERLRIQTVLDCTNEELANLEAILDNAGTHVYEHYKETDK